MEMSSSQYARAKEEINELIKSGARVVGLDIFDSANNYSMTKVVRDNIDWFYELYEDYYKLVMSSSDEESFKFMKCLKDCDIIDTNTMESEDSFLLTLYRNSHRECAIDSMIRNADKKITNKKLIENHDKILKGTSSENKIGLRKDNLQFVGSIIDGVKHVSYFPVLAENVECALTKFVSLYNNNLDSSCDKYEALIRPIMYHGLIAALQMFNDGNTRLGRNIQHVELWKFVRDYLSYDSKLPLLYATRPYSAYRTQYRDCIRALAVDNNQDAWNEWYKFNLSRIQDSIFMNEERFKEFQRRVKK